MALIRQTRSRLHHLLVHQAHKTGAIENPANLELVMFTPEARAALFSLRNEIHARTPHEFSGFVRYKFMLSKPAFYLDITGEFVAPRVNQQLPE